MKNLILTWCFMLPSLVGTNLSEAREDIHLQPVITNESDTLQAAIKITEQQAQTLSEQFHQKYPKRVVGGILNKTEVQTILSSMPVSSHLVNFRFCIDPSLGCLCLMLCGDKKVSRSNSFIRCIRNGGDDYSVCFDPTDWDDNKRVLPVRMVYEDYLALSNSYHSKYPKETFGGNIDKRALKDIIQSLPEDQHNIVFKFFMLGKTKQMGVIFIGGAHNQPDNDVLIYRNGKTESSFTPSL